MEAAIFWLPLLGAVLLGGIAGSAWYGGNKSLGLWVGFGGVICFALVAVLQIQERIWKAEAPPLDADRPIVLPQNVGTYYIFGAGPGMRLVVNNYGKSAAVLQHITGKFMMLELPLTKEKVASSNASGDGQNDVEIWKTTVVLAPDKPMEANRFFIPASIQVTQEHGMIWPKPDTPAQLFLFVTIEYEDLNGTAWIGRTCWKHERPGSGMFARYGGKDWNYEERRP